MQNLTTAAAMLKTVYRDMMVDMLNNETALYSRMRKVSKEVWEGKDFLEWPIKTGRTQAFGSGRPGGPIPEPQHQMTQVMKVPLRYMWGRIALDTPTMKVARSNRGSYKRMLEFEMDGFKTDFIDWLNERMWADGRGIVALVNVAGVGTTTLTVDSPSGVAGSINGARFLQPNMRIAILSADGSAVLAVRRVVSVASDGNSVTLNAAVSAAQAPDNAIIVRAPNLTVSEVQDVSYLTDPMGLLGMIDDGTYVNDYFNVNRTTTDVGRSTVLSAVGALNIDTLQMGFDVASQVGRGKIRELWMHHSTRRAYLALTVANRRFVSSGGAANFDIGFKGGAQGDDNPKFNEAPIHVDKDAPYKIIFGLDTRYLVNFINTDFEWADEDGAVLNRIDGVDAFEAFARFFTNFGYDKPSASVRYDGVNSNIAVVHIR